MDTHAHAEGSHAGASVGTNLAVWIGLVAITGIEVFLAYEHLPATLAPSSKEGLFRVLVGPYRQTSDVADAKAKLKTLGFSNTIVQKQ